MLPPRTLALVAAATALLGAAALQRATADPEPAPATPRAQATTVVVPPKALPRVPVSPTPATPVVPVIGGDVSWPNCPIGTPGHLPKRPAKGLGMPGPEAQFVIIGLTNGPGFYPNPCLSAQVFHAQRRHLLTAAYAFTTMPNPAQVALYGGAGPWPATSHLNRIRNASYAEAQINVDSIRTSGLRTPIVWMDVEPQDYIGPWGTNVTINRGVLEGAKRAYHQAGFRTGYYSASYAWDPITGGMRDSSPTWVTSGPRSRAVAAAKCSAPSFSGGPVALSQYWVVDVMDYNLTCPLAKANVERFFARN